MISAVTLLLFGWAGWSSSQAATNARLPAPETLRYAVNWPSGLSLGEAQLSSAPAPAPASAALDRLRFEFSMDVSLPGFLIAERASSLATAGLCSLELNKEATRGKRRIAEQTSFDQAAGTALRQTTAGGDSHLPIADCAKDALTFVAFLRRELAQGRLPATQTVWFGAPYEIHVAYAGSQRLRVLDEWVDTDRLQFTLKGPVAAAKFEISFSRDPARTPVLIRVPLPAGTFTMELTR